MPLIQVRVIEGVFNKEQRSQIHSPGTATGVVREYRPGVHTALPFQPALLALPLRITSAQTR
jgi:hypothetical protein